MHKWRSSCPDVLLTRLEEIAETRFYLLRQTGPTAFLVKQHDGEAKFKVLLGSSHFCDCSGFLREKELCIHILWILMKKFRVPKDDPIVYQLGLCERELSSVLYGRKPQQSTITKPQKAVSAGANILKQKHIDKEDICPICQEEIYKTKRALTFCKFGCGNSVHISCIKIWADHQHKSTQEEIIKCPLCRTEFASYKSILNEHRQSVVKSKVRKQERTFTCRKCTLQFSSTQIQGLYRCRTCTNFYLCSRCFKTNPHKHHSFEKKGINGKWGAVEAMELSLTVGGFNFKTERETLAASLAPNRDSGVANVRRPQKLSRLRSSSQVDLRDMSFGISGLKIQERQNNDTVEKEKTSENPSMHHSRDLPSKLCLPPLSNNPHGLVASSQNHGIGSLR